MLIPAFVRAVWRERLWIINILAFARAVWRERLRVSRLRCFCCDAPWLGAAAIPFCKFLVCGASVAKMRLGLAPPPALASEFVGCAASVAVGQTVSAR